MHHFVLCLEVQVKNYIPAKLTNPDHEQFIMVLKQNASWFLSHYSIKTMSYSFQLKPDC